MKLSIVSTMYKSAAYIEEFHRRMTQSATKLFQHDYEIVFVDDGSPDDSLQKALNLQNQDPRVRIVELARNFGHHPAIVAGLEAARGEFVFLMDCDLEEQPEWLEIFVVAMQESDADVVFGVQRQRAGSGLSKAMGEVFWRAINWYSSVRIPTNPMTCRLMKRAYVDALLSVGDRVLFLAGTFAWAGFVQKPLVLSKVPRLSRYSSYKLPRKLLQVSDSFTSFSVAPLILIFVFGLAVWVSSILYGVYVLSMRLLHPEDIQTGFTSLAASIWFLGGSIILILGVLGLYISKLFQEVKRRPLYIVKKRHEGDVRGQ